MLLEKEKRNEFLKKSKSLFENERKYQEMIFNLNLEITKIYSNGVKKIEIKNTNLAEKGLEKNEEQECLKEIESFLREQYEKLTYMINQTTKEKEEHVQNLKKRLNRLDTINNINLHKINEITNIMRFPSNSRKLSACIDLNINQSGIDGGIQSLKSRVKINNHSTNLNAKSYFFENKHEDDDDCPRPYNISCDRKFIIRNKNKMENINFRRYRNFVEK